MIVGDGILKVPIWAKKEKWEIDWPKRVDIGHCWVGDRIEKRVAVKNTGGQAMFKIKNASGEK